MKYYVTIGDRTVLVDLSGTEPVVEGRSVRAELAQSSGTPVRHLLVDGISYPLIGRSDGRRGWWNIVIGGRAVSAEVVDERTRNIRAMSGVAELEEPKVITAPMPGLVVRINVKPGDVVQAGQGVIVVEAMKMENELKALGAGTVARIDVTPGQPVEKGTVLISFS